MSILRSFPAIMNAIARLSGAQNGLVPTSASVSGRGSIASSGRSQI
jgi:hypothetical protein